MRYTALTQTIKDSTAKNNKYPKVSDCITAVAVAAARMVGAALAADHNQTAHVAAVAAAAAAAAGNTQQLAVVGYLLPETGSPAWYPCVAGGAAHRQDPPLRLSAVRKSACTSVQPQPVAAHATAQGLRGLPAGGN